MFASWSAGMGSVVLLFALMAWVLTSITGSANIGFVQSFTIIGLAFAFAIYVYRMVSRWFDRRYGAK